MIFKFIYFYFFVTPEGFTTVVANECLEKARAYLNLVPRDRKMQCKLQVETPSDYTYSLFWAELNRLLGEKIPVDIYLGPLGQ